MTKQKCEESPITHVTQLALGGWSECNQTLCQRQPIRIWMTTLLLTSLHYHIMSACCDLTTVYVIENSVNNRFKVAFVFLMFTDLYVELLK